MLSLFGTMMSYTALLWLALHVPHGGAPALAAVDAAPGRTTLTRVADVPTSAPGKSPSTPAATAGTHPVR